ncbi:Panacea domain-containing protein [Bacillus sp. D386]|uniref:Panacea domain-containing protein n=1 Tax=Bacillus sp. D386 TaxID=2587155 RepID=UPI001124AE84|nr:type II toxin-antitoxin system antitoxin SocA domain-containing protein [Bacillus sp. D386]
MKTYEEIDIYDIADYFISLSVPGTDKSVTPLKLQKLTFYAQALSYAVNDKPLFNEDFEAWVHGPVSPNLYYKYKNYRSNEIDDKVSTPDICPEAVNVIKIVWDMYGDKDGKFLENKTHNELPWRLARGDLDFHQSSNKIIPKPIIDGYYSRKYTITETVR